MFAPSPEQAAPEPGLIAREKLTPMNAKSCQNRMNLHAFKMQRAGCQVK